MLYNKNHKLLPCKLGYTFSMKDSDETCTLQHLPHPPPLPHPHGAPHAAFVTVVGLHFQHMGAAGFPVQCPEASCHQPSLSVYAEQIVAVPCKHTHTKRGRESETSTKCGFSLSLSLDNFTGGITMQNNQFKEPIIS